MAGAGLSVTLPLILQQVAVLEETVMVEEEVPPHFHIHFLLSRVAVVVAADVFGSSFR